MTQHQEPHQCSTVSEHVSVAYSSLLICVRLQSCATFSNSGEHVLEGESKTGRQDNRGMPETRKAKSYERSYNPKK
jgi:hypothetical protein